MEVETELETGFIGGDCWNLPKMDCSMVAEFFARNKEFCSNFRNVKKACSGECYGDEAIGYVQLKRDSNICTVKCNVCPYEPSQSYSVSVIVDEKDCTVLSLQCHDCTDYVGCVHSVAFLLWLHRRSEEPDFREVKIYWEKSFNDLVGTKKFATVKEMFGGSDSPPRESNPKVLEEFVKAAKAHGVKDSLILRYYDNTLPEFEEMSLYHLVHKFKEESVDEFLGKISPLYTAEIIKKMEESTRKKTSNLFHELRYARITPSKAYEVTNCRDSDTSTELKALILGEISDAPVKKQQRVLESKALQLVKDKLGADITKCGLFISKDHPMIAGSPHGVGQDFLIEIVCKKGPLNKYITKGKPSKKYYAQIQLQMYVSGKKKSYFCITDTDVHNNLTVNIIPVDFDETYVHSLLESLVLFWKTEIYPLLFKTTQD